MQERNVIGSVTAATIAPFVEFYEALTPFIMIAIVLIITDARFGIEAAQKRGETIRVSRKWRRAINKLVDYICWVSLAGVFSNTYSTILGIPTMTALVMLIVYGIELISIFNNYFEYKGLTLRISFAKAARAVWKRFTKVEDDIFIKKESSQDVDDAEGK